MTRAASARLVSLLGLLAAAPVGAQVRIFADGFESANTLAWAERLGEDPAAPVEAFRISDLDLRDPHVYADTGIFGCQDFTDAGLPGVPSFNQRLATAITTDSDSDTYLDASYLFEFRPFDPLAAGLRVDLASGLCTAPMAGTTCTSDPSRVPQSTRYDGLVAGTCLAPLSGTTYGPYSPDPAAPVAPCFRSQARDVTLDFGGIALPLEDLQVAARLVGSPVVTSMSDGLLRGFLSEAAAATILLPADLPLVGGQPLTVVLPGGAGSCAGHDDRDTYEGVSGWWFYFDHIALPVPFTGP